MCTDQNFINRYSRAFSYPSYSYVIVKISQRFFPQHFCRSLTILINSILSFNTASANRVFWSSMNLISNLLLVVSKEAISSKNCPNQPPLNARTIDLERDSGNSKILCSSEKYTEFSQNTEQMKVLLQT